MGSRPGSRDSGCCAEPIFKKRFRGSPGGPLQVVRTAFVGSRYHGGFSPMSDLKPLAPEVLLHIAQVLEVPMKGLVASIELLDEGGTVPFIARYRKEATGNLDEVQIRSIEEKLAYFRDLPERRAVILASIAGQGKVTDELRARIEASFEKS